MMKHTRKNKESRVYITYRVRHNSSTYIEELHEYDHHSKYHVGGTSWIRSLRGGGIIMN